MRILFLTSPGLGHTFPTIPTAWALRAAGHDVLIGTGGNHEVVAQAGLPVVDVAPGVDFGAVFGGFLAEHPQLREHAEQLTERFDIVGQLFGTVSATFIDGALALARRWRPDLVSYTPLQGAGPLVAAALDVPSVVHTIGVHTAEALWYSVGDNLAEHYRRLGVRQPRPDAVLDVAPPSMRSLPAGGDVLPMRYVPYNGAGVLADWLFAEPSRRRVTVTLGSVLPEMGGASALTALLHAIERVDAEFVFALGGKESKAVAALGTLPDNVRVVDWVPLRALLAVSDAVIHHGGAGTTLTAMVAGVPQLVLPQGADQFANAASVRKRGVGTTCEAAECDRPLIDRLLTDDAMRTAAGELADEIAGQPAPAEVVGRLVERVR